MSEHQRGKARAVAIAMFWGGSLSVYAVAYLWVTVGIDVSWPGKLGALAGGLLWAMFTAMVADLSNAIPALANLLTEGDDHA